jgi:hypothetical protein
VSRSGLCRLETTTPRGLAARCAHGPKGRGGLLGVAQPTAKWHGRPARAAHRAQAKGGHRVQCASGGATSGGGRGDGE